MNRVELDSFVFRADTNQILCTLKVNVETKDASWMEIVDPAAGDGIRSTTEEALLDPDLVQLAAKARTELGRRLGKYSNKVDLSLSRTNHYPVTETEP